MTGLEAAVIVAAGGAFAYAMRDQPRNRIRATRSGGRTGRLPRGSRLVRMYNSTGAVPVDADNTGDAAAVLAGRVLGASGRKGKRMWRTWKTASERNWAQRQKRRPQATPVDKWRELRRNIRRRPKPGQQPDPQAKPGPQNRPPDETGPAPRKPAPPQDPPPAAPGPALGRPGPSQHAGDPQMTTPATPNTAPQDTGRPVAVPVDWAALISRVADFTPEDDVALIDWMTTEAAGLLAYAEALEQARLNCIQTVGLDPTSVSGIASYSQHMSEAADRATAALLTFKAVYGEVLQLAAEGVTMPYNGRWMTGGTA